MSGMEKMRSEGEWAFAEDVRWTAHRMVASAPLCWKGPERCRSDSRWTKMMLERAPALRGDGVDKGEVRTCVSMAASLIAVMA
jgi:hypothetical protein